jgi:hypothetical protein
MSPPNWGIGSNGGEGILKRCWSKFMVISLLFIYETLSKDINII